MCDVMITELLSKLASKIVRVAEFVDSILRQNYSAAERLSLLRARRPRRQEVNLLDYRVSYLSEGAYQLLLREIFFKGEYQFSSTTDSPLIVDCGANIGLAMLFFKRLYPKARVLCFEAEPVTASVLRKNVEQNHLLDVTVHNLMLSGAEGDFPFYTGVDEAGILSMSANPNRVSNHREIIVKAGRLSRYIEGQVELLKLDVEGTESDVMMDLKSSGKLPLIRRMIIEYHHKIGGQSSSLAGFLLLLEEAGFEYQLTAAGCDPITRQGVYQDVLIGAYRP